MGKLTVGMIALNLLNARPAIAQEVRPGDSEGTDIEFEARVVDLSCKVVYDLSGADHRTCSQICADSGVPLVLLADGDLYLPVGEEPSGVGANERLRPHAERDVRVRGTVIERAGLKAIVIESIERP